MSKVAEYIMDKVDTIADKTGYDSEFLFDQFMALTDDGETMEEALTEVEAIAVEQDY